MNKSLETIVTEWVADNSKVIDFGCGDGSLLKSLADSKSIIGYGVENDPNENMDFDMAIMASSIQCLRKPKEALQNILEVANQCVITLPNFGNWELRTGLLKGKMPSSATLPAKWYETKNVHMCTIADFEELCATENFNILKKVYLNRRGNTSWLTDYLPNFFAAEAVYLLGK
jgi:methionine biosynthesis protein MetW